MDIAFCSPNSQHSLIKVKTRISWKINMKGLEHSSALCYVKSQSHHTILGPFRPSTWPLVSFLTSIPNSQRSFYPASLLLDLLCPLGPPSVSNWIGKQLVIVTWEKRKNEREKMINSFCLLRNGSENERKSKDRRHEKDFSLW